jgi:hypothetical protein
VDVGNAAGRLSRQARLEEELGLAPFGIGQVLDAQEDLEVLVAIARAQIEQRVISPRV